MICISLMCPQYLKEKSLWDIISSCSLCLLSHWKGMTSLCWRLQAIFSQTNSMYKGFFFTIYASDVQCCKQQVVSSSNCLLIVSFFISCQHRLADSVYTASSRLGIQLICFKKNLYTQQKFFVFTLWNTIIWKLQNKVHPVKYNNLKNTN